MTPKTVKATFKIEYITKTGQVLWMSISEEEEEGIPERKTTRRRWASMKWTAGHIWTCETIVTPGHHISYSFHVMNWMEGGQRGEEIRSETIIHTLRMAPESVVTEIEVNDGWDVFVQSLTEAALALSLALHPRLGGSSPASVISHWIVRDIAAVLSEDIAGSQKPGFGKVNRFKATRLRCPAHKHDLTLTEPRVDNGWKCDGKPCAGGFTRFSMTHGIDRWSCRACDFDLCLPCAIKLGI